ncbi:3179_t:CDS:2, partial [Diversispora eburnea]
MTNITLNCFIIPTGSFSGISPRSASFEITILRSTDVAVLQTQIQNYINQLPSPFNDVDIFLRAYHPGPDKFAGDLDPWLVEQYNNKNRFCFVSTFLAKMSIPALLDFYRDNIIDDWTCPNVVDFYRTKVKKKKLKELIDLIHKDLREVANSDPGFDVTRKKKAREILDNWKSWTASVKNFKKDLEQVKIDRLQINQLSTGDGTTYNNCHIISELPKYNDASRTDSEDKILEKPTKNDGANKNADILEGECSTRKLRDTISIDYNHNLSETYFSDSDHESDKRKQSELDDESDYEASNSPTSSDSNNQQKK